MKYQEHPNEQWRVKFLAILDQLNEYDGEFDNYDTMSVSSIDVQLPSKKRRDPSLASIDMNPRTGQLTIESINCTNVQIKYYLINVEILFSRAPFLQDNAETFSYA